MKHKITFYTTVIRRGPLGIKRKVREKHTVEVDGKTYKKLMQQKKHRPYTIEEMMVYDDLFGDE